MATCAYEEHAHARRGDQRAQGDLERVYLPEEEHLPRGARASAPEAGAVTVNITFREVLDVIQYIIWRGSLKVVATATVTAPRVQRRV